MGAASKESDRTASASPGFASAKEVREVLERLLSELERDSDLGPAFVSTHVTPRFVFPDVGLVLNVSESDDRDSGHSIRWAFSDEVGWKPALTLEMDSDVANRYLQGRESLAIAIARRRIRCHCESRAALRYLPVSRRFTEPYLRILRRDYPHLLAG